MSEPCRFRRGEGYEAHDDASTRTPAQGKDWNEYLQQRGRTRERGDYRQAAAR